jgi:hypothetical protein
MMVGWENRHKETHSAGTAKKEFLITNGETQSWADIFGRKVGLKDSFDDLFLDACSAVFNRDCQFFICLSDMSPDLTFALDGFNGVGKKFGSGEILLDSASGLCAKGGLVLGRCSRLEGTQIGVPVPVYLQV